jgi:hypothetical protein
MAIISMLRRILARIIESVIIVEEKLSMKWKKYGEISSKWL